MIRYPVTVKQIKKDIPSHSEEDVICNEEGEVLGLKGNVAKLSQLFRKDDDHKRSRSNSLGRINSKILLGRFIEESGNNASKSRSSTPVVDRRQSVSNQKMYSGGQFRVDEVSARYDRFPKSKVFARSEIYDRQIKNSNEIKQDTVDDGVKNYKNRFQDHNPRIRELKKREELKIYRDRKGSGDATYRSRYMDNTATFVNDELHFSMKDDVITKSRWNDYETNELPIKSSYEKFGSNEKPKHEETNQECEEFVETWEEFHTVPYYTENISSTSNFSKEREIKNDNLYSYVNNNNKETPKTVFADKESAFQHLLSLKDPSNKNENSTYNKRRVNYRRKSLAELLGEYQQKGVLPQNENHLEEFSVKRGEFFIENNIDTTSAARTIDVIPQCAPIIESNANPYQNTFRVSKENPLYTNNNDFQDTIGKNKWRIN